MKEQRWYNITTDENGLKTLNVYSSPNKEKAQFSSHVSVNNITYYRNSFKLQKVWTEEEIEKTIYCGHINKIFQ